MADYTATRGIPMRQPITITELDTMDVIATAELSDGRTLVAGVINPGTPAASVTVFNARGKRECIGGVRSGTDMVTALEAAVEFLNSR